ncbi:MAG: hypothetical protein ACXAD7_08870 [Candidatus Kariarchaeaceae archaeon]
MIIIPKTSNINFRISEELSEQIDAIVAREGDIRNRSDFGMKAIHYFLRYKYNVGEDDLQIGVTEWAILEHLIPQNERSEIIQQMEEGIDMNQVLEEYKERFFLLGLEERIEAKSRFLEGVEPRNDQ